MSGDPTQVIQFLAQNDAACPTCGYSLRGCTQLCCPECGDEISLALRGESSNVFVTAMRYLLWAIGARSLVMLGWWTWASLQYSFSGPPGSLGTYWYFRMAIGGAADIGIGVLSLMALRRLKLVKVTGKFRGIAKLVAWIGILIVADVVIGVVTTLAR